MSGSTTSTDSTEASSLLRTESGSERARSRLALAAAASSRVPSWKVTPSRSLKVSVLPSSLVDQEVASCGTKVSSGVTSTSLSQSEV